MEGADLTNQRRLIFTLTGLFLTALILLIIGVLGQGRHDYALNIAVKACVWVIYAAVEIKYGIEIKSYIRVLVMTMIISDSFFGLYLDLYSSSTVFDKIQHIFGSYAFALFAYNLICQLTQPVISRAFRFILVISLGLSIGALYEITEFIGDLTAKPKVPSQTSLLDTDLDLIADAIGSLLAAVHATTILSISCKRTVK
jgi:uncharacterized membrane protein YjdF